MVHRSPHPDVPVPDEPLHAFVLGRARTFGDRPAFIDGPSGRGYSFAQVCDAAARVAAGLAARGLAPGDRVGLFCPNLPEYPIAFFGVLRAGGVVTTANSLYTADELGKQLADACARFLITVAPFLERAQPAAEAAGVEEVFVIGEAEAGTPFAALLGADGPAPDVEVGPDDLAVLPYSSGTTGLPKGVMLTHRNLAVNILQTQAIEQVQAGDVAMGILPFFHIYGMTCIMNLGLYTGIPTVTMPRFDLEQFLALVQERGITRASLVPPIILALAKHPAVDDYDLTSLRHITSGAAPLSADTARACMDRVGCAVKQGYGLTETAPVTHIASEGADPASVGPPVPNTECAIVDVATAEPLGPNERGEFWIRGPQVMRGYLNRPSATAAMLGDDGWLHTGDIAYADERGAFYIVDRLKELIKYKGYQVAPAELEGVLLAHEGVADAAVIPVPDEAAGEIPKGFVVRKPHARVTEEEIMAWVAERVAPYKKLRRLTFVEAIPKSASGKILRRELVRRERAAPEE